MQLNPFLYILSRLQFSFLLALFFFFMTLSTTPSHAPLTSDLNGLLWLLGRSPESVHNHGQAELLISIFKRKEKKIFSNFDSRVADRSYHIPSELLLSFVENTESQNDPVIMKQGDLLPNQAELISLSNMKALLESLKGTESKGNGGAWGNLFFHPFMQWKCHLEHILFSPLLLIDEMLQISCYRDHFKNRDKKFHWGQSNRIRPPGLYKRLREWQGIPDPTNSRSAPLSCFLSSFFSRKSDTHPWTSDKQEDNNQTFPVIAFIPFDAFPSSKPFDLDENGGLIEEVINLPCLFHRSHIFWIIVGIAGALLFFNLLMIILL